MVTILSLEGLSLKGEALQTTVAGTPTCIPNMVERRLKNKRETAPLTRNRGEARQGVDHETSLHEENRGEM